MAITQNVQTRELSTDSIGSVGWLERVCSSHSAEEINVARQTVALLLSLNVENEGLIAGFLNSLKAVSEAELEQVANHGGESAIDIFNKVQRIRNLSNQLEEANQAKQGGSSRNEENLRKMLIAMVDDVRVVLIVLACQLVVLRFAKNSSEQYQKFQAKRIRDIYGPLANRLGVWQIKWELEDLGFRYSNPQTYKSLAENLEEKRLVREQYIERFTTNLTNNLSKQGIRGEVYGRPKHIYSIWKKMQRKSLEFHELWDIRAARILVDSIEDCYAVLSVVHELWQHVPSEFSDYIATPKPNGYQSIHTIVNGPENKIMEIQIRTRSMHQDSEFGVAAHWRYKESVRQDSNIDRKVAWLRQLLDWKAEVLDATNSNLLSENTAHQSSSSNKDQRVYIFTPKGTIVDLPNGATPIDFAYAIHSEVGHRTRGATVDGKMVPLHYKLQTGEQVHIQTTKKGGPSLDWLRADLGYVKTNRARNRISQWHKHEGYDQHVAEGRTMLERELTRLGLEDLSYSKINQHTHFRKVDDLLAAIGTNDYKVSRALSPFKKILDKKELEVGSENVLRHDHTKAEHAVKDNFKIYGADNFLTRIANCCNPVPGDEIVGYITKGSGISIHRKSCINIQKMGDKSADRFIEINWNEQFQGAYSLMITIVAFHGGGLLHDITEVLQKNKVDILKVNMDTNEEQMTKIALHLSVAGTLSPDDLTNRLSAVENVFEVKRVG